MRHHIHNYSAANIAPHPCMAMIYNFPDSCNACLPTSANQSVIHASLYLAEIINAALRDKFLSDSQRKEQMLEAVAKELGDKLSSLSHRAGTADVGKITKGLGKHLSLQKHFTFCKFISAIHTHALQHLDSYFFSCCSSSILVLCNSRGLKSNCKCGETKKQKKTRPIMVNSSIQCGSTSSQTLVT